MRGNGSPGTAPGSPTGALSFEAEFDLRAAGTWDESKQTETTTVCAYRGVGCILT